MMAVEIVSNLYIYIYSPHPIKLEVKFDGYFIRIHQSTGHVQAKKISVYQIWFVIKTNIYISVMMPKVCICRCLWQSIS